MSDNDILDDYFFILTIYEESIDDIGSCGVRLDGAGTGSNHRNGDRSRKR